MKKEQNLKYDPKSQIRVECNNWYEIDEKLIKVCMRNGNTIILNTDFKRVWIEIGYGIGFNELITKLGGALSDESIGNILETLLKVDLINIIQPEDEFDIIFN